MSLRTVLIRIAPVLALVAVAIVGVTIAALLGGCDKAQNTVADPKAFQFWVIPW